MQKEINETNIQEVVIGLIGELTTGHDFPKLSVFVELSGYDNPHVIIKYHGKYEFIGGIECYFSPISPVNFVAYNEVEDFLIEGLDLKEVLAELLIQSMDQCLDYYYNGSVIAQLPEGEYMDMSDDIPEPVKV